MKMQLFTTSMKISQRKLIKGYPCLTQNDDGTIGLNIAGPKSNYKSKSKLEICRSYVIPKKISARLLNGFLTASVLLATGYVSSFLYINRLAIYESFISLIPVIQTNEKKNSLPSSSSEIEPKKSSNVVIQPLPIPAPLGKNSIELSPRILPPPSTPPNLTLAKPTNQDKTAHEIAVNVVLNKPTSNIPESLKTNEITVGITKKPQWVAITINDDQLVMTNSGETAQFSVGQTLPSGEILKTIDAATNQYSTNLSTHSIKGEK